MGGDRGLVQKGREMTRAKIMFSAIAMLCWSASANAQNTATASTPAISVNNQSNVGIGMAPEQKLDVNGTVRAASYMFKSADFVQVGNLPACTTANSGQILPVIIPSSALAHVTIHTIAICNSWGQSWGMFRTTILPQTNTSELGLVDRGSTQEQDKIRQLEAKLAAVTQIVCNIRPDEKLCQ